MRGDSEGDGMEGGEGDHEGDGERGKRGAVMVMVRETECGIVRGAVRGE